MNYITDKNKPVAIARRGFGIRNTRFNNVFSPLTQRIVWSTIGDIYSTCIDIIAIGVPSSAWNFA